MTISKKFNSALLAVGFVAALAVAASPASAQTLPLTGSLVGSLNAYKDGTSKGHFDAEVGVPVGASVSAKVLLGKRVLCKTAKKKQVTEGALTKVSCTFPLRKLANRKAQASAGGFVYARLEMEAYRDADGKPVLPAPVIILIPIAVTAFQATQ